MSVYKKIIHNSTILCHKQRIKDLSLFCRDLSHFRFTHFLRKVIGKNYGWRKVICFLCTETVEQL